MTWEDAEIRRIKLIIARSAAKADNLSVVFSILGKQKTEFETMMIDYLTFVEGNGGVVDSVDEIKDSETGQRCELIITISGSNVAGFIRELQAKASPFTIR